MVDLTIRRIPDALARKLEMRAALEGRGVAEQIRAILEQQLLAAELAARHRLATKRVRHKRNRRGT